MIKTEKLDPITYQNVNLSVNKYRVRIGCDICKIDGSTECFIGWCGNVLWICRHCFKKITKKKYTNQQSNETGGKNGKK